MISLALAARQVLRFGALVNPPETPEAQEELAMTLRRCAVNDEHAVRIVDAWMRTQRFRPAPSELESLAEAVSPTAFEAQPDLKCSKCCGTGWEPIPTLDTYERTPGGASYRRQEVIQTAEQAEHLRRTVDGQTQRVYDNVRRCRSCGYGRALQAAVDEREASPAKKPAGFEKASTIIEREKAK